MERETYYAGVVRGTESSVGLGADWICPECSNKYNQPSFYNLMAVGCATCNLVFDLEISKK